MREELLQAGKLTRDSDHRRPPSSAASNAIGRRGAHCPATPGATAATASGGFGGGAASSLAGRDDAVRLGSGEVVPGWPRLVAHLRYPAGDAPQENSPVGARSSTSCVSGPMAKQMDG